MDRDEIMRVLRAFQTAGVEYVLIGAAAMGFHGVVKATQGLDLFIRATAENIERLLSALRSAYESDPDINDISTDDLLGDYPAVRYYPPSGDLYLDVLTRLGEVATFETVEAEIQEIDGTQISVATPSALYKLKKGTVRLQDQADAAALREHFHLKMRNNMPVLKFRSIEEMNKAPLPESREPHFERFLRHCARWWALAPKQYSRGVFKFRTIEEAQKAREKHTIQRIDAGP